MRPYIFCKTTPKRPIIRDSARRITNLEQAILIGDVNSARFILKRENELGILSIEDKFLFRAISLGKSEIVELLLDNGANVNSSLDNITPLHLACVQEFFNGSIIKILFAHGANPNTYDHFGMMPLHVFVWTYYFPYHGEEGYSKWFPADYSPADTKSEFNLMKKSFGRNISELLKYNININALTDDGCTVLEITSGHGDSHCMKVLMDRGADPSLSADDYTCIDSAVVAEIGLGMFMEPLLWHYALGSRTAIRLIERLQCDISHENGRYNRQCLSIFGEYDSVYKLESNLEIIKRYELSGTITLYTVLINKDPTYMSNADVIKKLELLDLSLFSPWERILEKKIEADATRFKLMEKAKRNFNAMIRYSSNIEPNAIPTELVYKIVSHLDNEELREYNQIFERNIYYSILADLRKIGRRVSRACPTPRISRGGQRCQIRKNHRERGFALVWLGTPDLPRSPESQQAQRSPGS